MRGWLIFAGALSVLGVPVYVMLPLDLVSVDGHLNNPDGIRADLTKMRTGDVDGVMFDVWWGVVERAGPMSYDWSPYEQLVQIIQESKLKAQAVMSFHQCGGNVGDSCNIPLPQWVLKIGQNNSIFYSDYEGNVDREYVSLGVDSLEILDGRTPPAVYTDFMQSFAKTFADYLGSTIVQIQVGLGPAGELRYPSYPSSRWRFPGVGEFQCYDKFLLSQLNATAYAQGHPDWGHAGPNNAGSYNDYPSNTGFFSDNGSWNSDYGRFFLTWYSSALIQHGEAVLKGASQVFGGFEDLTLAAKISGIHWWYGTRSHAAELTAGYYNVDGHDGYTPIVQMFGRHNVSLDFTMLEMTDRDNPQAQSLPEELIKQVFSAAIRSGIDFGGENALERYDQAAYDQIAKASQIQGHVVKSFTYLRWSSTLQQSDKWSLFLAFVSEMHGITTASLHQRLVESISPKRNLLMARYHHTALLPPGV